MTVRILYIQFSVILGGYFCLKSLYLKWFFKNILLIQYVAMLTQFNVTDGTAIAISYRKEKINTCLNNL
jgi:hypothetical protein